jgi:hypothetical protein
MLIPITPAFRKRRGRVKPPAAGPPPAPLTLVSAAYFPGDPSIVLTFDRAIDIAALNPGAITVDDPAESGVLYEGGGGAALAGPTAVQMFLLEIGSASGAQILLNASAANGIVAVDDGGTWPGVTGYVLNVP